MKNKPIRPVSNGASSSSSAEGAKEYLEFELDTTTLAQVTALAEQAHCTPFTLCLGLLKESLSLRAEQRSAQGLN